MSEPDHKARAIALHRRAQRAEARAERATSEGAYWRRAWEYAVQRAAEARRERDRIWAFSERNHSLIRIIKLGKQFP